MQAKRRSVLRILAIATALFAVMGAGCMGGSSKHAETLDGPVAFRAALGADRASIGVVLTETARVLDRDLVFRNAYVLKVGPLGEPTNRWETYYLDGLFRIVRVDTPCAGAPDPECERYLLRSWERQGELAPFGIGLLHAYGEAGDLNVVRGRVASNVPAEADGDLLRLGGVDFEYGLDYRAGTYTYSGSIMPTALPYKRVYEYDELGALPRADIFPIAIPPGGGGWRGNFATDQDAGLFGSAFTLDEFIEALETSSVSASSVQDGCVARFLGGSAGEAITAGVLTTESEMALTFNVANSAGGPWDTFVVTATADILGRKDFEVRKGDAYQPQSNFTCDMIRDMPPPALSSNGGDANAGKLFPGLEQLVIYSIDVELLSQLELFYPPEAGWLTAQYVYEPAWTTSEAADSYDLYDVLYDVTTGWLVSALSAP